MSSSNIVPAFCMRSRTSLGKRVYLNFCVCDDVPCPKLLSELELASILDSPDPERYRLPVFISKKTSISDQSDESCDVYCIAFNKSFYEKRVKTSALHRKFLIALGVQEVEKKHNIVIDPLKLRELRNTQAMGDVSTMITVQGQRLIEEIDSSESVRINPTFDLRLPEPSFVIRRTIDDKGDHLLAEFRLNGVTNKEGIQLMAGQRRIRLVVPRHYHLDVVLPVRFDSSSTEAEFNADNFVLKAEFRVIEERVSMRVAITSSSRCTVNSTVVQVIVSMLDFALAFSLKSSVKLLFVFSRISCSCFTYFINVNSSHKRSFPVVQGQE